MLFEKITNSFYNSILLWAEKFLHIVLSEPGLKLHRVHEAGLRVRRCTECLIHPLVSQRFFSLRPNNLVDDLLLFWLSAYVSFRRQLQSPIWWGCNDRAKRPLEHFLKFRSLNF